MKPTRAPGISDSTPSSIPTPARRIGQIATFLPEMRRAVVCSSGVSISTSSSARSFVASYVRSSVSSFDELPEHLRRRRHVAQEAELVLDERVAHLGDAARRGRGDERSRTGLSLLAVGEVRRVAAEAGIERALSHSASLRAAERAEVGAVRERLDDDARRPRGSRPRRSRASSRPACRRGRPRRPSAAARRTGRCCGSSVSPTSCEPLLGVLARPLGRAQVELEQVRVGPAGEHVEPAARAASRRARRRSPAPAAGSRGTARSAAIRKHVAFAAITCSSGPPCMPGKTARSIAVRVLLAAEDEARRAGRRASCASSR